MKLAQNKIEEVILDILGPEGLRLVKELKNRDNISEFSLANKLRKDIKVVRHLLYKLYNYNLVYSTRKKDKQKGWYIYYWTLLPENIHSLYLKNQKLLLQKTVKQVEKEQTEQFYSCPKRCVRLDFDQSLDFEFHCPECGELISLDQDPARFRDLQKKIAALEKEIAQEEKVVRRTFKKARYKKRKIKQRLKVKKIRKRKTAEKRLKEVKKKVKRTLKKVKKRLKE